MASRSAPSLALSSLLSPPTSSAAAGFGSRLPHTHGPMAGRPPSRAILERLGLALNRRSENGENCFVLFCFVFGKRDSIELLSVGP